MAHRECRRCGGLGYQIKKINLPIIANHLPDGSVEAIFETEYRAIECPQCDGTGKEDAPLFPSSLLSSESFYTPR